MDAGLADGCRMVANENESEQLTGRETPDSDTKTGANGRIRTPDLLFTKQPKPVPEDPSPYQLPLFYI